MIDNWYTQEVISDLMRILDSIPGVREGIKGGLLYGYRLITSGPMGYRFGTNPLMGPIHGARGIGP